MLKISLASKRAVYPKKSTPATTKVVLELQWGISSAPCENKTQVESVQLGKTLDRNKCGSVREGGEGMDNS